MKKETRESEQEHARRIDWNDVRRRLETSGAALARDAAPSMVEQHAILRGRARAFAREAHQVGTAGESLDIIEFRLASETYGIASAFVREVSPLKDVTPLPGTPPFVLGIINVRGQIFSVVNLKKFFNLPERGLGELNQVIILRDNRMEFGILADAILGMYTIPLDAIQPSPSTVTGIGAAYLRGVTAERVIILDAAHILHDEQIIINQETGA